ncbi:hypothetical protein EBZ80_16205 [bacterium]|nr:hypothetical protein [bacterium]
MHVRYFQGSKYPKELADLRRQTFVDETKFLPLDDAMDAWDESGVHICVFDSQDVLLGATHVLLAEESDFGKWTWIPDSQLKCAILSRRTAVAAKSRNRGIFQLLLYLGMRWGRMRGRKLVLGFLEDSDPPVKKLLQCEAITGVPLRQVSGADGHQYHLVPTWGDVQLMAQRSYSALPRSIRDWVRYHVMPEELTETVRERIFRFYENPWLAKTLRRELSRNEYGRAIANLHQYVRWTTRLLAQMTGQTADPELRAHFMDHLSGEIDHERMLEADLRGIGWDVEWVMNGMAPDPDILNFMSVQQSLVAFERDPVLFLMVPLVAEGLSAFLDKEFIAALEECATSWGIANPRSVTKFLRSHIHTDGGDDGHWAAVQGMIAGRIRDEAHHQRALAIIDAVAQSMNRAWSNYVAVPDFAAIRDVDSGLASGITSPGSPVKDVGEHQRGHNRRI